jgi:hypothetical protein
MQYRVYTVSHKTASTATARSLVNLVNNANICLVLLSAEVVAPDDDTNEQFDCVWQKITNNAAAAGTAVTPSKVANGDPASVATCLMDLTVEPTTYAAANVDAHGRAGAPSLGGWRYTPTEKEAKVLAPSEVYGLRLLTALGVAKALTVRVTFGEIG